MIYGRLLGPPHGTTPAAVIANKNKTEISLASLKYSLLLKDLNFILFKSSEHINEKAGGLYHGFGYLSLFSDPLDLTTWSQRELHKGPKGGGEITT